MSSPVWRAPGSGRAPVRPSWTPTAKREASLELDAFRSPQTRFVGAAPAREPEGLAWLELRPGIVPLRPLRLGDVYGGVVRAIRGNVGSTMGLAAGTTVVFLLPLTALGAWMGSLSTLDSVDLGIGMFAPYVPMLGSWLSSILLAGFMAYVIGQGVLGRRVTPRQTLSATVRRIGALLLATLLVVGTMVVLPALVLVAAFLGVAAAGSSDTGTAALLGLVGLGVPAALVVGLLLQSYFAFTTSAVVLERLPAVRAIRRSWALVGSPLRSGFWRILGTRVLTSVIAGTISQMISTPMSMIGLVLVAVVSGDSLASSYFVITAVLQGVVAILSGILTTPLVAGVDAMLYIDARIRREALDVQLVHADQGDRPIWQGAWR